MWLEGRVSFEFLRLIRDPVFRGDDVPPGLGKPVLLIPGFLAGDWTLRTQFDWLRRVGYRPRLAGVAFNVMYSEVMLRPLIDTLLAMHHKTASRVSVIGHSRGGVLAKVLSHRKPDLVEQVITLGSPLNDPFDVHPLTMAGVHAAHLFNAVRYGASGLGRDALPARPARRAARSHHIDLFAFRRSRQLEGVPAPRPQLDRGARQPPRTGAESRGVSNRGAPPTRAVAPDLAHQ